VTGDELARLLESGEVTVLDVRTPEEFLGEAGYPCDPKQGHIEGALNVPLDALHYGVEGALDGIETTKPFVTYCHSGQRSEIAAVLLRSAGFEAQNYEGSWHEWSQREA
jgi:3-mercaptopyruvate sulfurtransferase SseA